MKVIHVAAAAALATTVTVAGMYGAAAAAASTLAASITTEQTDRHSRSIEFAARNDEAAARYRTPAPERTSTTERRQKP